MFIVVICICLGLALTNVCTSINAWASEKKVSASRGSLSVFQELTWILLVHGNDLAYGNGKLGVIRAVTMDVGELFCHGHQSQFQDRRRLDIDTKIQLFSPLL